MRVLMTGGGTGGHINPAIAIAKTILKKEPDSEIAFVGTSFGMENRLVPKEGFHIYHVDMKGMSRSLSFSNVKTAVRMITSVFEAKKIIRQFKPDICIGTGGYVCWPLIKAASEMKIPTALHESNALAGVAVKLLAPHIDVLFTNFETTASQIKKCKKIMHVGNPLKNEFSEVSYEEARKKLGFEGKYRYSVLSCGGSLGANKINSEVLDMMENYTSKNPTVHHLHQTGVMHYDAFCKDFRARGLDKYPNISVVDYIYDMPCRLSAADVIINRAGAMTISELAMLGKTAVLIPSPNVTDNHQYKNAKVLADADSAVMIEEKDLSDGILGKTIANLLENREKRRTISENISSFAVKNANDLIYNEIKTLVNAKKV